MHVSQVVSTVRSNVTFTHVVILSTLFRLALIIYGEYHDAHSVLKYTDIDYRVFSDAAQFIANPDTSDYPHNHAKGLIGKHLQLGDPYTRATYRYTPLLALLLVPNSRLHPAFGKVLFSLADILIGILLRRMLILSKPQNTSLLANRQPTGGIETERESVKPASSVSLTRDELLIAGIWLLDPFPANISTRGSAESVLGLLIILTLYHAIKGRWSITAALLGLSVHWKIYPIIYVGSLIVFVGHSAKPHGYSSGRESVILALWKWLTNRQRIKFALIAASSFFALSGVMYLIWGYPFLEHAYLYHIGRTDHRHNFSPYFYPLYLGLPIGNSGILGELEVHGRSRLLGLLAFIPQILLSIGGGLWLAVALSSPADPTTATTRPTPSNSLAASRSSKQSMNTTASQHLPFIFLVQTLIFVALNKVCTSQYFMWYLWFLPLVISHFIPTGDTGLSPSNTKVEGACEGNGLTASKTMWMVGLWVGSQALWLSQGYRLEFLGEMVFVPLWAAGIVMLGVNSWLVACLLKGYRVE